MVYFRCTSSGSGKGNTVIVTCAEQFAGVAVTIAKIGKSYTKVCPLTAPYVIKFYGLEAGTYTVSATVSGQTYSTEVIVQDVSCVLNYGFTWKLWVDTASKLDSSDYASLSEVLADEEAVRELFTEHACVDYMASVGASNADLETIIENDLCAKWINNSDYALDFLGANTVIKSLMDEADKYGYGEWVVVDDTTTPPTYGPKGNVPVMTANNAPYGVASASSEYTNNPPWKAFNGSLTDWWSCQQNQTNPHITYKFTVPTAVKRVRHWQNENGGATCKIRWSDDGVNFTDVANSQYTTEKNDWVTKNIDNIDYHLYWDVYFIDIASTGYSSSNLQFYGRELKVSVPVMTSNTAPFGEAIASSWYSASANQYYIWQAFDGTNTTQRDSWVAQGNGTNTAWIGYHFIAPTCVKKIYLENRNESTARAIKKFKVQASNDGSSWTDITQELTNESSASAYGAYYSFDNNSYFLYYRIFITDVYDASFVGVGRLQFYGLDYSEKEFEVGTTKKWLYDHGVELAGITAYKANASNTAEKENNQLYLKGSVGSSIYGFRTETKIDLTAYSLIRTKVGNKGGTDTRLYFMGVVNAISDAHSSAIAEGEANIANAPNNESLSISSVNGSYYPVLRETNGGSSSSGSISEWWLE